MVISVCSCLTPLCVSERRVYTKVVNPMDSNMDYRIIYSIYYCENEKNKLYGSYSTILRD